MDLHDLSDGDTMIFGGVVLAVRQAGAWKTYAVESGGDIYAAKATADGAHQILVSMLSRGDPGTSFTVMVGDGGFAGRTCATIPFPDTLNQPGWAGEYLQLDGLNGVGGGRLTLIGHAEIDVDGVAATEHFRYESADGGRSWSGPTRLDTAPAAPEGGFSELGPAPDLVADFLKDAR